MLTCTGLALGSPMTVLVGVVWALTAALRRRLPIDTALPLASLALLGASVTAGVAAALLGIDLLARPGVTAAALAMLSVAAAGFALRLTQRPERSAFGGVGWIATVPATATAALGLMQGFRPELVRSWAFWGTDFAHHLAIVRSLQDSGNLDYSAGAYPKGLHMLAALLSVPNAPQDPLDSLDYTMSLFGALTLLTLALLLWTASWVALRLGQQLGLAKPAAVAAAVAVGVGPLLTNTFVQSFVFFGAAQSFLAATSLLLLAGTAMQATGSSALPRLLMACSGTAMLLSHLWQPLAAAPVVAGAVLTTSLVRHRRHVMAAWRNRSLPIGLWLAATTGMISVAAVPLVTVQQQGGAAAAATPGELPDGPWLSLVLALLAATTLIPRSGERWVRVYLGLAAGLLAAVGVLVKGAGNGWDLAQYYPLKSLWFVLLFLAPLLTVRATGALAALWRVTSRMAARTGAASLPLRTAAGGLAVATAFAVWLPWLLGPGSAAAQTWSVDNARSVVGSAAPLSSSEVYSLARDYGTRFPGSVVVPYLVGPSPAFDSLNSRRVSGLLAFLTGQREASGAAGSVCQQIHEQAEDRPAVVLTRISPTVVRRQMDVGGCAGEARVVRVTG